MKKLIIAFVIIACGASLISCSSKDNKEKDAKAKAQDNTEKVLKTARDVQENVPTVMIEDE